MHRGAQCSCPHALILLSLTLYRERRVRRALGPCLSGPRPLPPLLCPPAAPLKNPPPLPVDVPAGRTLIDLRVRLLEGPSPPRC